MSSQCHMLWQGFWKLPSPKLQDVGGENEEPGFLNLNPVPQTWCDLITLFQSQIFHGMITEARFGGFCVFQGNRQHQETSCSGATWYEWFLNIPQIIKWPWFANMHFKIRFFLYITGSNVIRYKISNSKVSSGTSRLVNTILKRESVVTHSRIIGRYLKSRSWPSKSLKSIGKWNLF